MSRLEKVFESIGKVVSKYPWLFLFASLVFGSGLSMGNLILETESRPEKQWVPNNAPSLKQKDYVDAMYPSSLRFSSFIATCKDDQPDCNVLDAKYIQHIAKLLEELDEIEVNGDTLRDKEYLGFKEVPDEVWNAEMAGMWSYSGNATESYNGGIVKNKCYAPGPICLGSSILSVFRDEEKTIAELTDEGALRGLQSFDGLEIFCPLSITRMDSPCFNATVHNAKAGANDCKIKAPTKEQRIECELSFRNYCKAVCDRLKPLDECEDESCMRTSWYNQALLDFDNEDPTLESFDPPIEQLASSGSAGPTRDANGNVLSAKAMRATLFLASSPIFFEGSERDPVANEWENAALCKLGYRASSKDEEFVDCPEDEMLNIVPFFARSIGDEFGAEITGDIPFVSMPYLLVPVYLIIMLSRRDHVHSMVTMGLIAGMIVIISYFGCTGAGGLLGIYSSNLTGTLPLLLLGLGVDDAFVIVGEYERYYLRNPKSTPEERIIAAAKHGGVSILITSVTDALAFLIGSSTVLPALSWFCVMAGVGVVLCFIFQLTIFLPVLLLNARRSDANRYDCCCCCGPSEQHVFAEPRGCCKCCNCKPDLLDGYCGRTGSFISAGVGRILVLTFFAGSLAAGIVGMANIETNFEFEWFLPDVSYSREFFALNEKYFGGGVNFDVYTREMDYFANQKAMGKINEFLTSNAVIDQDEAIGDWHKQFLEDTRDNNPGALNAEGHYSDEEAYYEGLLAFFQGASGWGAGANLRGNVKWTDEKCDTIEYSASSGFLPSRVQGQCPEPPLDQSACFEGATTSFGFANIASNQSAARQDAPPGCSVTRTGVGSQQLAVLFNTDATSSVTCGSAAPAKVLGKSANPFVTVEVQVDAEADLVTILLQGPPVVWYGVGFNATEMDGTYVIIVDGEGAVTERILGDHDPGLELAPSLTVVSDTVQGRWRSVEITRPLQGKTADYLTFSTGFTAIPIITAMGSTVPFRQHTQRFQETLLLLQSDQSPTCLCPVSSDLTCNHMLGIKGSRISATLTIEATTGGVNRYNSLVILREGLEAVMPDLDKANELFPYTSDFSTWEEIGVIGAELTQNLLITGAVIVCIIVAMIPHPRIAFFVILSIVLSIVNLVGFMHWWGLSINGVSTIYILLSCGLAVDYSAHIAHMFVVSTGTPKQRVERAMIRIGPSVFNGVVSTFIAVISLSLTKTYVFQVFAKALALTVLFGGAHGLLLLPALLSIFGGSKDGEDDSEVSSSITMVNIQDAKRRLSKPLLDWSQLQLTDVDMDPTKNFPEEEDGELLCITYESVMKPDFRSVDTIKTILEGADKSNSALQIGGRLWVSEDCVTMRQTLEGPADAVRALFVKIELDNRHDHVKITEEDRPTKRAYQNFGMKMLNMDSQVSTSAN